MFDIGFPELIVITIVGLLVIGPDRLPEALRTLGLWVGRMRRSFTNVKNEIEKEIGMDEIRRQLHNEAVMEEMKRIERDVRHSVDSTADHSQSGEPIPPASPEGAEPADPSGGTEAAAPEPSAPADHEVSTGTRGDRSDAAPPGTPTDDEHRRG